MRRRTSGYHLKLAGAFLRSAGVAAEGAPEAGCRNLQESAERSLKALVIASGRPVAHTRNLRDQAELYDQARTVVGDLHDYAARRVPLLAAAVERRLAQEP